MEFGFTSRKSTFVDDASSKNILEDIVKPTSGKAWRTTFPYFCLGTKFLSSSGLPVDFPSTEFRGTSVYKEIKIIVNCKQKITATPVDTF